jgi:hypothetical protein
MITADRRAFLSYFAGTTVLWAQAREPRPVRITKELLRGAATVAGLTFSEQELDAMME